MVVPRVQAAIASAFGEEYRETDPVVRPSQFADIQINAAMALAKKVGLPPRDAAARIVEALDLDGICTAVEISGPGFINLTFDGTWIEELLNAESPGAQAVPAAEAQRVVVDYSSPNVAKEMHVGHLRTTVVGDSLVKVLRGAGRHRDPAEPHRRLGHPVRHADRALAGDRRGLPGGGAAGG